MRPEDRDLAHAWDMLQATRDVVEFTTGLSYARFSEEQEDQIRRLSGSFWSQEKR